MHADPASLRQLLLGGDRRSIARSNDALALVRADPKRIAELVGLANDADWLVVMRAVDLLEKLAHEHPEQVQPYRKLFIGALAEHPSWEIRLQIARTLPLLQWTPAERKRVVAILHGYAQQPQKFVKAWSVDGLSVLAVADATLLRVVEELLQGFEHSGSPALVSRARRIRARQAAMKPHAAAEQRTGIDSGPAGRLSGSSDR